MLVLETIAKIRRDHLVRGVPIKKIARDLRVSKNTVRKVVRGDETSYSYARKIQPMPKLGPWVGELERRLEANEKKPRRDRLSLLRIHEDLLALGYGGGYDAVRRYARIWRRRWRLLSPTQGFVPLSFDPGEAYQFDWSHEYACLSGVTTKVKAAHMRLCHSRMQLVQIFPRESQEMVFEAHERAFHFFGGVCRRGIYDNMKTAVSMVFVGKERAYNRRFLELCSHHLVEPVACTPGAGWEKGQVEKQVGDVRGRLFVPSPRGRSYAEINAWLMDRCIEDAKKRPHPTIEGKTVLQVFEEERPFLMAYRGPFDGFHATEVSVSKTCLVRFDNNHYSVAASAVGRTVDVRAYADRIVIRQDGETVAEHPRSFGRGEIACNPWHYVPILTRKPGALRDGAPFKGWQLPGALGRMRARLTGRDDGDRQIVKILAAVLEDGLEAVEAACAEALACGACSADIVLNILARHRQPPPPPAIPTPEGLQLRHQPATMAGSARLPRWASTSGLSVVAARTELPAMQMPAMAGSVMGSRSSSQARNAANRGERCSPRRGSIGCRAGGGPVGAAGTAVWISGMMGTPRSGGKESAPPRDRTGRGADGTGALRRGMRRSRQYGRRQRRFQVRIRRYGRHAVRPRHRWKAGRPGR